MTRSISLVTLVSLLTANILSPVPAGQAHGQEPGRHRRLEPKEGSVNNEYVGTVTKVTKGSITIQRRNGSKEPPKSFELSDTLAAGKIPMAPRTQPGARYEYKVGPDYMYRLMDVRVGDWVKIRYARLGGIDICDHVCITRRPDGLIPPLPKEAEDLGDWRKVWKARTGRPLPDWIGKTPHMPYHEYWNARWAKVAPMPRAISAPRPTQ